MPFLAVVLAARPPENLLWGRAFPPPRPPPPSPPPPTPQPRADGALRGPHPLHRVEPDRPHRIAGQVAQFDEAALAGAEREATQQHPVAGFGGLVDCDLLGAVAVLDQVARAQ